MGYSSDTMKKFVTIKIPEDVYEELKVLREPEPKLGKNFYNYSFGGIISKMIKVYKSSENV